MKVSSKFIPPHQIRQDLPWSPVLLMSARWAEESVSPQGLDLQQLGGTCIEGWRVSQREDTEAYDERVKAASLYRQVNVGSFQFHLDPEHFQQPAIEGNWCVEPGDVVINKIAPIRAALATTGLPRHPIDGNCVLVRGLSKANAFWFALCVNHPLYQSYLLRGKTTSTLPRVSLSALRELTFPASPPESFPLMNEFWACCDGFLSNQRHLIQTLTDIETRVRDQYASFVELVAHYHQQNSLSPGRRIPASDIDDSWVPFHVELDHLYHLLDREIGWVPLALLAVTNATLRLRLDETLAQGRYLRLSDVGSDLIVHEPAVDRAPRHAFRVYREPLLAGEVLLSKLATNPRVAFVDEKPETPIYITDHWERLQFRETPGAWALLLNTSIGRVQIERMAMGSTLQFTNSASLQRLRLPPIPREERIAWEEAIRLHHQRKRELQSQWECLLQRAETLFASVHQERLPDHTVTANAIPLSVASAPSIGVAG